MFWGVPSWSATCAANTVTVHASPPAKSETGSSVKLCRPPATDAACRPLDTQAMLNQEPLAVTGSLKLTVMFAPGETFVAPFAGLVPVTVGGRSSAGQAFVVPGVLVRRPRSTLF